MSAVPHPGSSAHTPAQVRAIEEAAAWYAVLCSGSATEAERRDWERWRSAAPAHGAAWERVEAMQRRLAAVPGAIAAPTLSAAVRGEASARRAVLRNVAGVLGMGVFAGWAWRQPLRQELLADLRTGTGEQREQTLADGSRLALNTRTAVDVAFDAAQRLLVLRTGEILVQTAADPQGLAGGPARPFLVDTPHGRIRALGTRFLVRSDARATRTTVLEHAVQVHAQDAQAVVHAGQQLRWGAEGIDGAVQPADAAADAWHRGSVVADDMPLAQLLDELGRYRSGFLGCDPAIAGMRVSGAFPVPDSDRALSVLVAGLPVRMETRTRYWVRVVPA